MPVNKKTVPETTSQTDNGKPLFVSNYGLSLAVYILYLLAFITGLSSVIGVIIAYLQSGRGDPVIQSHTDFQIRTFWIGLIFGFVGMLTIHMGIGFAILLWWVIWTLVRCVKGMLALNAGEPIGDPQSLLFG